MIFPPRKGSSTFPLSPSSDPARAPGHGPARRQHAAPIAPSPRRRNFPPEPLQPLPAGPRRLQPGTFQVRKGQSPARPAPLQPRSPRPAPQVPPGGGQEPGTARGGGERRGGRARGVSGSSARSGHGSAKPRSAQHGSTAQSSARHGTARLGSAPRAMGRSFTGAGLILAAAAALCLGGAGGSKVTPGGPCPPPVARGARHGAALRGRGADSGRGRHTRRAGGCAGSEARRASRSAGTRVCDRLPKAGCLGPAAGVCLGSLRFGTGGCGIPGKPRGYRCISVPGRIRSTCPKAARTRGRDENEAWGTQPKHLASRYPPFALLPRAPHLWYGEQVSSGRDGRSAGRALAAAGGGSEDAARRGRAVPGSAGGCGATGAACCEKGESPHGTPVGSGSSTISRFWWRFLAL